MLYDVIVVGSGPGGAVAAAVLAAQGKSVLLADRQEFPRDKVCGDGLPLNVMVMLRELGLDVREAGLEYQRIRSLSISGPGGQTLVTHEVNEDAFSMTSRRLCFDNMLHQHALKAGATFEKMHIQAPLIDSKTDRVVGVIERRGKSNVEHEARMVIAADGASSAIARALLPSPSGRGVGGEGENPAADSVAVAIRGYGKLKREMEPCVYFYFNKSLLPGYAWIFPIANGFANVGVYLDKQHYRKLGRSLEELLTEFLADLPPEFALELDPQTAKTWPLPCWSEPSSRTRQGVLLVGDAGRFVNAITGGGIYPAMVSGLHAAHQTLDILDGTLRYPAYDPAWRRDMAGSLQRAWLLQRHIAPRAWLFDAVFAITKFPPIKAKMLRVLSGEHY